MSQSNYQPWPTSMLFTGVLYYAHSGSVSGVCTFKIACLKVFLKGVLVLVLARIPLAEVDVSCRFL